MERLRTINECLSLQEPKGPVKGVYGSLNVEAFYDEDEKKIIAKAGFNAGSYNAQINESIDRTSVDKLESLKRDINMVMKEADKKIHQLIDKYGFK